MHSKRTHTQSIPQHLVSVGWPNALEGGADLAGPQGVLIVPINSLVEVEDQMGAVGDEDAA